MPTCDISGKSVDRTIKVRIEGVVMNVAPEHAGLGERVGQPTRPTSSYARVRKERSSEPERVLIAGYGKRIRQAREKTGMTQEQMAKMMMEKASVIHQVESEHLHPSQQLCEKFKKYLHIDITTAVGDTSVKKTSSGDDAKMTLGDLMKKAMK